MVRLKTRYLLFEIIYPGKIPNPASASDTHIALRNVSDPKVDARVITRILRDTIQSEFGEFGAGVVASTISIKYFSNVTNTGIARVGREHFRLLWGALSSVTEIMGRRCIVTVVRVSGTIKKCEQAAIARNKRNIESAILDAHEVEGDIIEDDEG